MPFQMAESTQTPFNSMYLPRSVNENLLMPRARGVLDRFTERELELEIRDLNVRSGIKDWGIDLGIAGNAQPYIMRGIDNFREDDDRRFRAKQPSSGGYQYADFHVINTFADDIWGWFLRGFLFPHNYLPHSPAMMSEGPFDVALTRFGVGSYVFPLLASETMAAFNPITADGSCLAQHYANYTPADTWVEDLGKYANPHNPEPGRDQLGNGWSNKTWKFAGWGGNSQYCLPGQIGPKGPFTNRVRTNYPSQAALTAHYRGLRYVEANPFYSGAFHSTRFVENGNIKRDEYMMLHPENRMESDECDWMDEDHFIPDLHGPARAQANRDWYQDDEGNIWNAVAWHYIRGCGPEDWQRIYQTGPLPELYR